MNHYFYFVQWYYEYLGNAVFDNALPKNSTAIKIGRKERLPVIVLAYLLLLASVVLFLLLPPPGVLLSAGLLFAAIVLLCMCRFGLFYYYLMYRRYRNRDHTVNDCAITEECILLNSKNVFRKTIEKHYRIIDIRGNIFAMKYHLVDKSKKNKRLSNQDILVLTITPTKMLFQRKEVFSSPVADLSVLDDFLRETQRNNAVKT